MATKLTADVSSVSGGQAAALELAQNLMRSSSEVGETRAVDRNIYYDLRNEGLPQQTCEMARELAHRVSHLVRQVGQFEESIGSEDLASIDGLARMMLTTQFEAFKGQVEELKGSSLYTLRQVRYRAGDEVENLLPVFEKQVGQYLQTRNVKDLDQARASGEAVERMNRAVSDISNFQTELDGRKVEYHEENPTDKRIRALTNLIGGGYYFGGNYESVMRQLDGLVAEGEDATALEGVWGFNKERIDQTIDRLHDEVGSDQVNYWVWKLSGEKPGENYGLVHRYDDLGILKEAILRTTKSLADKIMKEEAQGLDQEAVYVKLFEIIGEPQVENPMVWMKENACYYTQDLQAAIREVKFPRREIDLFDNFDDFPPQFNFASSSILTFEPSLLSSFSTTVIPQKHDYTLILDELAELEGEEISSDLRGRVEEMIGFLSKNGLADTINYEIWRLGGEKPGDNWGVVHRYDDAAVLRQALMIALRRDVHEQYVVETFADEEDRNAFYTEIGRIAYAYDSNIDGVPADLVAYGKEKIVFHLHQLGSAKEEVQAQIQERREAKARESDEAIDGLMKAAVSKNPAAHSVADMLRLINQATGYFAPTSAAEACKAQIRERVEAPTFDAALKNQIFLGVWRANNEPLGDSKWGDKHYLDDLETLSQVLLNILVEIGLNGEQ
ncbi:MAG: hypothetical protein JSR39_07550 [Verrucomicrobia bacterium]|nr:hypothetical protein [Verrucomicrobiota bacterium]